MKVIVILKMKAKEKMSENESKNENKKYTSHNKIKELNDWFETIDQTKSLEDQIEILKTKDALDYYWYVSYYNDNKDLNYKLFKAKAAYLLNELDEHLKNYLVVNLQH